MNREFLLVFAGGMVSLVTTLVILLASDFIRQRNEALKAQRIKTLPNPESNALKRSEFFKAGAAAEKKDASSVQARPPSANDKDEEKKDTGAAEPKPTSPDTMDSDKKTEPQVTDSSRIVIKSDN